MAKNNKILTIKKIKQAYNDQTPVFVKIQKIIKLKHGLGMYIPQNIEVAKVQTEKNFIALIKKEEYELYHNSFPKNNKTKLYRPFQVLVTNIFEVDGKMIALLSGDKFQRSMRDKVLEEIKQADSFTAKVVGFMEYGAILEYKNVKLELSNSTFSFNKDISLDRVFHINDQIQVKFDRLKKNGRVIRVVPITMFPKPEYLEVKDFNHFQVDDIVKGKVVNLTPASVSVMLGYDSRKLDPNTNKPQGKMSMIVATMEHPEPVLDEMVIENMPVTVQIYKINPYKIYVKLVSVDLDTTEGNYIEYKMNEAMER